MPKFFRPNLLSSFKGKELALKLKAIALGFFRKLLWRAHWLLPNHMPRYFNSDSNFYQDRDVKYNLECTLPEGEELCVQVVWGAEVYGPSETNDLCEVLTRWGWTAGGGGVKRDTAAEWIHRQRSYGIGGWYNVGLVTSTSDRGKYVLPTNELQMPENVKYLMVEIFQITPALTCVVVGFALSEKKSQIYASELKKSKVGRYERAARWSITRVAPPELKRRAIASAREDVRGVAKGWFKSNLPGYFCKTDIDRLFTCELLTTLNESIFSDSKSGVGMGDSWREVVARSSRYDVWSGVDGISFISNQNALSGDRFHLIISMCKSNITDEAIKYRGGRTDSAFISHCGELMTGVISNFASVGFLTEALKDLRLSRASLEIQKIGRGKGLQILENIQAFFDRSLGTPAIAIELRNRSEYLTNFQHDSGVFTAPSWRQGNEDRTLAEELREYSKNLSIQVIDEEHSLREHFEQLSSIISVRESIKAQRRMEILTISALAVAVVSLLIAITQNPSGPKYVADVLVKFLGL